MEARIAKVEADVTAIKIDLAVIKANYATKDDLAELRAAIKAEIADLKGSTKSDIAEAKTSIIVWVVGAIFVAQLLAIVKDMVRPAAPTAVTAPNAQLAK